MEKGDFMNSVNSMGSVNTVMRALSKNQAAPEFKPDLTRNPDVVELSSAETEPPKINAARIMFRVLTDEQIAQINKSGKLPSNGKFIKNAEGAYDISNNFFNLTTGTQILPEGYEVKKDVFGFARVLPKGTEGALIK